MNRIRNIALFICATFLSLTGRAQINLVLNPSFEDYALCPDFSDETKYCNHWMSLDSAWNPPDWAHDRSGVPDYCNACSTSPYISVPNSLYYYHYPHTGNGMMELMMYSAISDTIGQCRDYLQGHLRQTLFTGHRYNVLLHTTVMQVSGFAVNHIGAYFDDGTIDTTSHPSWTQFQITPQIFSPSIINDTLNWIKIEDTFTANGTEKIITIGNFFDKAHTSIVPLTGTEASWGWYLIDDVSVIDCSIEPNAGNDTLIHASDSAWLGPHENLLPYTWYKLGTTTPIDSGGGIWVRPTVTTTYILEQKLCGVTKFDTVKVTVIPSSIMNYELLMMNVRVYPNPATNELTITGAEVCVLSISDITGRMVLQNSPTTLRHTLDISGLGKGVYFVKITDPVTGESITKRLLKE